MLDLAENFCVKDDCPRCGRIIQKTVAWLEQNRVVVCDCGEEMPVDPTIGARFRQTPKFGYTLNRQSLGV